MSTRHKPWGEPFRNQLTKRQATCFSLQIGKDRQKRLLCLDWKVRVYLKANSLCSSSRFRSVRKRTHEATTWSRTNAPVLYRITPHTQGLPLNVAMDTLIMRLPLGYFHHVSEGTVTRHVTLIREVPAIGHNCIELPERRWKWTLWGLSWSL